MRSALARKSQKFSSSVLLTADYAFSLQWHALFYLSAPRFHHLSITVPLQHNAVTTFLVACRVAERIMQHRPDGKKVRAAAAL